MAKFSASALKKDIEKSAKKSACSKESTIPIAERTKEIMRSTIEKNVYDKYSPKKYKRRKENDGLLDNDNIITIISDNHITIENIAEPNKSIFGTPITENPKGLLYDWMDNGLISTSMFPPSFTLRWKDDRIGMTEKIVNNEALKDFIAKTIVKNMK